MKEMFSYYDLLNLIQKGVIPQRVWLSVGNRRISFIQDVDGVSLSFCGFIAEYENKLDDDIHRWLGDNFLESDVFDKCLEFEFKQIKKLNINKLKSQNTKNKIFQNKINEIIDKIAELESKNECK